jgi:hypothetical protein
MYCIQGLTAAGQTVYSTAEYSSGYPDWTTDSTKCQRFATEPNLETMFPSGCVSKLKIVSMSVCRIRTVYDVVCTKVLNEKTYQQAMMLFARRQELYNIYS